MLRQVVLLCAVASASAYLGAPVAPLLRNAPAAPLLRSSPAASSHRARSLRTSIKMLDSEAILAAAPGFVAVGMFIQKQRAGTAEVVQVQVPAETKPTPSSAQMLPIAQANFKMWNDALQTKNPDTVAALYSASELSFLPTVSPKHIKGPADTKDYFTAFVQKNPFGTITDESVTVIDNGDGYLHSGLYTFELGDAGARTPVEARFSYMWKKVGGAWKIVHHHSSASPGAPAAAPAPAPASSGESKPAKSPAEMLPVARENFKRWNDALQTKDNMKVAALYSTSELTFLPTVSPKHIKASGDTEEYFKAFVQKNPFGTITDDSVIVFDGGDSYLHSGMYTFELGDAGARTPVEARFSYVWRLVNGDWKISHHHSSVRPADAKPTPSSSEMHPVARENFKKWNDALQTKDNKKVAALYTDTELSFLPTVSPKHIKGASDTEQYFEAFVQKNPFGTITDDSVTVFDGGDAYLHSGLYTFELGDAGARTPVEARFSYMWKKVGGAWKISHHHSSVRPVEAAATPSAEDMHPVARSNFKMWNDALQTKDNKKVAALYSSSELSFLPTVSPKHIKGASDTEEYFEAFVQKNPFGTITDDSVTVIDGGNGYLHSGLYTFELGPSNARTPVQARFSYMWKKFGNDWKITHHHSSVLPASPPSSEEMHPVARENFKMWNDALQTKDNKKVAALYMSSELSFLPTVSPKHIKGASDTEEYFEAFVQKNPFGTITDDSVTVFDNGNAYLHSGLYTFELGDAGARTPVEARFSYMWKKDGNDWKISHHHSSVRPADAKPTPSSAEMAPVARENFKTWNDALQTKDNMKVAALYNPTELSFLPTVSPKHIRGPADTQDYFKAFVEKNPFGTLTDESVMVFDGGDAYLHSGLYTFELGDAGARTPVEARFSYMWKKVDGEWKISHHHSSASPAAPAAAPAEDSDKVAMITKQYRQAAERLTKETALRIEQEKQLAQVIQEMEEIKKALPSLK